ncbi:MAG: S1 RNA-binding domain-containing protein [Synergistaceae bacterium]|jgi:small subunit ribosomal protein S1|nr:S1 RNA-binding domain-containing protein [Synergistaceae bacterium]
MVDEIRSEVFTTQEPGVEETNLVEENPAAEETMESFMEQMGGFEDIHRGKVVEGVVVDSRDDGWLVDVGYKCEGFLQQKEWTHRVLVESAPEPAVGDKVRVQVTNISQGEEAQLTLSRWRCEFDERWNRLEEELGKSEIVDVRGLRKVKGGLIVDCFGLEGFIPISHLAEEGRGVNPGRLVDQVFPVKILERDRRKRRFVLSRRSILEEEMGAERDKFYESVHEGDVLEGEVSSITSFGVFVNLGVIEGLIHVTELAWQRNAKAKDLVNKGDTVKVKVTSIDREKNRVSLSLRQTLPDPWESVASRWMKGTETEGVVTNMTDFGAFVEIEPGVEGLIHIGDISWSRIKHPKEVLKRGQKVNVVILDADMERKRISLGFKQLNDPWTNIESRFAKDQDIQVKVIRLADFGAFVELETGVEGLIHISQISRSRVEKPGDVLQMGQEVMARILEIDPATRRIRLSVKALQPEGERSANDGAQTSDRERRPRREDSDRRQNKDHGPQIPTEEMSVTLGDFLKAREEASAASDDND